ncbi:hypothetical protein HDU98_011045 [Podochytrium sp. JEL0797]|nr:hypothetical protein HDU98_011045 [Podochytrium sp. JEL0797]
MQHFVEDPPRTRTRATTDSSVENANHDPFAGFFRTASDASTLHQPSHGFYSNPASYSPSLDHPDARPSHGLPSHRPPPSQPYPSQPHLGNHQAIDPSLQSQFRPITFSQETVVDQSEYRNQKYHPQDEELARALAIAENAPTHAVPGDSLPKALNSPYHRNDLPELKVHRPYFLWTMTVIQVIMLIVELVFNQQHTGQLIATNPFNYMIGPSVGVIIQTGARFTPCIRPNTPYDAPGFLLACPDGISSSQTTVSNGTTIEICTLDQICGMGGLNGQPPNQWWRFITPVFLHGGVVHLLMNLSFQCRTGFDMEKDFGWWRMACIYWISGVGGFIFGGNYSGMSPSVGCSGALFGLIACLLIDLVQNWRLVSSPWWELTKLVFMIVLSFLLGTLPYLDNFAHVGGFFCGFLAGLIFMPTIYFSKRDKIIKITLQVVAVPTLILVYVLMIMGFYNVWDNCTWCKYLTCIPGMPWCASKWEQSLVLSP